MPVPFKSLLCLHKAPFTSFSILMGSKRDILLYGLSIYKHNVTREDVSNVLSCSAPTSKWMFSARKYNP